TRDVRIVEHDAGRIDCAAEVHRRCELFRGQLANAPRRVEHAQRRQQTTRLRRNDRVVARGVGPAHRRPVYHGKAPEPPDARITGDATGARGAHASDERHAFAVCERRSGLAHSSRSSFASARETCASDASPLWCDVSWTPESWKSKPAAQQPSYSDLGALAA